MAFSFPVGLCELTLTNWRVVGVFSPWKTCGCFRSIHRFVRQSMRTMRSWHPSLPTWYFVKKGWTRSEKKAKQDVVTCVLCVLPAATCNLLLSLCNSLIFDSLCRQYTAGMGSAVMPFGMSVFFYSFLLSVLYRIISNYEMNVHGIPLTTSKMLRRNLAAVTGCLY